MLPSRCRIPKILRHAGFDHRNGCDLENQSCDRSFPTSEGSGSAESLLGELGKACSVPAAVRPRVCFSELIRSAHCRSKRRWTLNGYMALIRATSLPRRWSGAPGRGMSRRIYVPCPERFRRSGRRRLESALTGARPYRSVGRNVTGCHTGASRSCTMPYVS